MTAIISQPDWGSPEPRRPAAAPPRASGVPRWRASAALPAASSGFPRTPSGRSAGRHRPWRIRPAATAASAARRWN